MTQPTISLKPLKNLLGWGEAKLIAQQCQVSYHTVFRALNDKGTKPNAKVLARLMQIASERKPHMLISQQSM